MKFEKLDTEYTKISNKIANDYYSRVNDKSIELLIKFIAKAETNKSSLTYSNESIDAIMSFMEELGGFMVSNKNYLEKQFTSNEDDIIDTLKDWYNTEANFNPKISKEDAIKQLEIRQAVYNLTTGQVTTTLNDKLKNKLLTNVVLENSISDLRKDFEAILNKKGAFADISHQEVRLAINGYNGILQVKIADKYNLTDYGYIGGIIDNTRSFCKDIISNYNSKINRDELKSLLNKYKDASYLKGVTIDNFPIKSGGFKCRHSVVVLPNK